MNKTRPKQLSFRVSEEEYRQLQEKILESGKNQQEYTIDKNKFVSKGHNTPFDGWKVKGKVLYTICDGKIIFENQEEK